MKRIIKSSEQERTLIANYPSNSPQIPVPYLLQKGSANHDIKKISIHTLNLMDNLLDYNMFHVKHGRLVSSDGRATKT